jgi:hypothetical protein
MRRTRYFIVFTLIDLLYICNFPLLLSLPLCTGQEFEDKELKQDGQDKQDEERIQFFLDHLFYPVYPAHPVLTLCLSYSAILPLAILPSCRNSSVLIFLSSTEVHTVMRKKASSLENAK